MEKMIPLALCFLAAAAGQNLEEKETIEKSFRLDRASAARRLEVDNVFGSIRIVGSSGAELQASVHQTIRAESKEKIQQARREVKLEIGQEENTVRFYVDGPFRCHCEDGGVHFHGSRHEGYKVIYDFEIKAPPDTGLLLRNISDGEIRVQNIAADYDIKNVNGGVEMTEIAGSGRATTVNGKLNVLFRQNPRAGCFFHSINGAIDLSFERDLSADFRVKTFNGKISTDFPFTYLPSMTPVSERRDGKFVYKADRFTGIRVGRGGPEIKIDGFNGEVRIREREK